MAFAVTFNKKTVFGDLRVNIIKVVPDGAEESIDAGVDYVYGFAVGHSSMTTGSPGIHANAGTTSTAANGYLGISGVATGDIMYLTVFGK